MPGKSQFALLAALLFATAMPASASIKRAWLSKYASYEVLREAEKEPLPGFLTTSGEFYNDGKEDASALSIAPGKDVGVIIDLGKEGKITVTSVNKEPSQVTILATGKKLDYRMDGKTLTFAIPADRTTALLDVVKVEW